MNKKIKNNFTLVEIAVVLVVLVALAGLVVPKALGYAQRSHSSTGAANIANLESNIARYQMESFAYPDNWDSLLDASGDIYSDLSDEPPAVNVFSTITLTEEHVEALEHAGIENVLDCVDDVEPGSFGSFSVPNAIEVGDTLAVVANTSIIPALFGNNWNTTANDIYFAFGIGENVTAIGKTISSAPVDFPEGAETPEDSYRRFIAIFHVDPTEDHAALKFVGVVANDHNELADVKAHVEEYYHAGE